MHDEDPRQDVIVVGARCAGAATAMLLARQGHRVTVVDRSDFPSDTLSTHALSRGGVVQLDRWGLLEPLLATGAPPIRRVRFFAGGDVVDRTIKRKAGVDTLVAPRRTVLDHLLVESARDAGARVRTGLTVTEVTHDDGRVDGVVVRNRDGSTQRLRARVVVGADGLRSRIARAVDAPFLARRHAGGAAHYTYFPGQDWDGFEFHISDGVMAGVFPTHGGEANVWACTPAASTRLDPGDRLGDFRALLRAADPSLAERLADRTPTAPVRGACGLPNHIRQAWGPGWALVGDAGLHRDPITGHGITDAFRDAELLARALDGVLAGGLTDGDAGRLYTDLRAELVSEVFDATCRMAAFPPLGEFIAQQARATAAMEAEARFLSDLSPWPTPVGAAA